MIADIMVAARAIALASVACSPQAADERTQPDDPDLDGHHLISHCYGGGFDLAIEQLTAWCDPAPVAEYLQRGLIVIGPDGRAGITVGRGYVVEPCGLFYAITSPQPDRWRTAWRPPTLLTTVVSA